MFTFGQMYTISGYVKEESTGESLLGTNVYIKENLKGTTTNQYGFYSLSVPDTSFTLVFSFIGFQLQEFPVKLNKNIRLNVNLKSNAIETKEVNITAEKEDRNIQSSEMGRQTLDIEKIKTFLLF